MTPQSFDFDAVPAAYTRRGSSQARHTSRLGAESAANRAETQTARYLSLLQDYPEGLSDMQAARLMGVERTTINARRSPLHKAGVVVPNGFVTGDSGVKNVRWSLK